jgi:delta24-sterol reductase
MYGDMVEEAGSGYVNHINRWYKPWFYKHAESFLRGRQDGNGIEFIPLRDYYHRHTRAYFWEVPIVLPFGNNSLIRWLVGWIYPLNFQLVKLFAPSVFYDAFYVTNHMLQDFILPLRSLQPALEFIHTNFEIYPIWLCPCATSKRPGMMSPNPELYVDVGIYGTTPKVEEYDPERSTRLVEEFARTHAGFQFLYADSYMSRSEFRAMFNMELYDKVRVQYGAEDAFPDVYDKVSKHARRIVGNSRETTEITQMNKLTEEGFNSPFNNNIC